MSKRQSWMHGHAQLLMGCLVSGCLVAGSAAAQDPQAAAGFYNDLLLHRKLVVHPGSIDVANRYRSIIQVFAEASDQLPEGQCSGSLIAPRLVLTAAHCVCLQRTARPQDLTDALQKSGAAPEGSAITRAMRIKDRSIDSIIEPSTCLKDVTVVTILHERPADGATVAAHSSNYPGTVRVHPEMELLFEGTSIVWSNADLAVIVLASPLRKKHFPVYSLPNTEVQVGERITLVGHGLERGVARFGTRRFGENTVSWINKLETGSVEFVAGAQKLANGGAATHVDIGDSGGGCFKAGDNKVLVGVIGARAEKANGDAFSVITSVYAHLKWLREQIEEARGQPPH